MVISSITQGSADKTKKEEVLQKRWNLKWACEGQPAGSAPTTLDSWSWRLCVPAPHKAGSLLKKLKKTKNKIAIRGSYWRVETTLEEKTVSLLRSSGPWCAPSPTWHRRLEWWPERKAGCVRSSKELGDSWAARCQGVDESNKLKRKASVKLSNDLLRWYKPEPKLEKALTPLFHFLEATGRHCSREEVLMRKWLPDAWQASPGQSGSITPLPWKVLLGSFHHPEHFQRCSLQRASWMASDWTQWGLHVDRQALVSEWVCRYTGLWQPLVDTILLSPFPCLLKLPPTIWGVGRRYLLLLSLPALWGQGWLQTYRQHRWRVRWVMGRWWLSQCWGSPKEKAPAVLWTLG